MAHNESFPRTERIGATREFEHLLREGERSSANAFVLYVGRGGSRRRIGIRVGRRVGTAVQRNRIKRLVREVYRRHRTRLEEGISMVVIVRQSARDLTYDECAERLIGLWQKTKILRS